jgi:hypothetical protein
MAQSHLLSAGFILTLLKHETSFPGKSQNRQLNAGCFIFKEADGSRWLTNREIDEGVIKRIEEDSKDVVIGNLEPREKRP